MEYYAGDPKRVQHFLKVYEFAKLIGESESLETETMHILRTAAIVHDIGIKISEEKYGSSNGKYQEKEGPAEQNRCYLHWDMMKRSSTGYFSLLPTTIHITR